MLAAKVLVLGNYKKHTLTVVRSLALAGYGVVLGRGEYRVLSQFSRHVSETWVHPDIEDHPEDFIVELVPFLSKRPDIQYVFPIGETDIVCLATHRHALPASVGIVMPHPDITNVCLNKADAYALASRLGIPVAHMETAGNLDELQAAVNRAGYPCVIKPENSLMPFFGKKALILHSAVEHAAAFPRWPGDNVTVIVQEFMQGFRHNCNVAAWEGKLLAYFETRTLRTDRADYTGYSSYSISCGPTPALREYCERLLRKLHYSGVALVQFFVDDQRDRVSFLEINPRLGASCGFPYRYGYDFPRLALDCVRRQRGEGPAPAAQTTPYPANKASVWLLGDMSDIQRNLAAGHLQGGEAFRRLGTTFRQFLHADHRPIWSWRDPLPACYEFSNIVLDLVKNCLSRLRCRRTARHQF